MVHTIITVSLYIRLIASSTHEGNSLMKKSKAPKHARQLLRIIFEKLLNGAPLPLNLFENMYLVLRVQTEWLIS